MYKTLHKKATNSNRSSSSGPYRRHDRLAIDAPLLAITDDLMIDQSNMSRVVNEQRDTRSELRSRQKPADPAAPRKTSIIETIHPFNNRVAATQTQAERM
uniref:Uncharacterized protein n=1 Tax=Plectus sambesii TaxID=2011161 RepID=A0A914VL60_9BILA